MEYGKNEENIIQTALNAATKPFIETAPNGMPLVFLPHGNGDWRYDIREGLLENPIAKRRQAYFHTVDSMIAYVKKHCTVGTEIFISQNDRNNIKVTAVIDGHSKESAGNCDHVAQYSAKHTHDAANWIGNDGRRMSQSEFAAFLISNARAITSSNPNNSDTEYPTAAAILDFATNLEYQEKTTFKSGYREQDGRINFTFTSEDAGKTETNLKMFERFGIALTPFIGGDSYFVEALLKFRIDKKNGELVLWYEIQYLHNVIEMATQQIFAEIKEKLGNEIPVYFGETL